MARTLSVERRALILDSALRLFAAKGVTATSTAEIARAAGIAAGTLFLYFGTKQELLDELVLRIAADQAESVRNRLSPSLSARETFSEIWQGSVRWFLEHPDAFQYQQQVRDTGMISDAAIQESALSLSYYFDAVQKGLAEASIKPYPADLIGRFLYQGLVAVMTHVRTQADRDSQEDITAQGFEIFWNGIKTEPETQNGEATQR